MSNTGQTIYGNVAVNWTASTSSSSLSVTITAGGPTNIIGSMTFTPTTLNQLLTYENNQQSASGTFSAEFSADAKSGTLSCKDFKWDLTSGPGGPITGIVGIWNQST